MDKKFLEFSVMVYGELEKFTDTLSKARCRVFYKYGNRNGSYITDEFAEKLIKTLPYTPVKGIYDNFNDDYTDHGAKRNEGRIYGIVPENPNHTWENHVDGDGVERTYLCVDVLIFTALYKEAAMVLEKPQSMELYEPTLVGDWKVIDNQEWFVFEEGSFLGLQILGDDIEPCFEGAAFFSLKESFKKIIDDLKQFQLNNQNGGNEKMIKPVFGFEDNEKYSQIWYALNPNFSEDGGYKMDYAIYSIEETCVTAIKIADGTKVSYEYTIAEDSQIALGETELPVFHLVVTEEEFNSYSQNMEELTTLRNEKSEFDAKISEKDTTISTLETEKETLTSTISTHEATISELNGKVEELSNYKTEAEEQKKKEVIKKYSKKLDQETLDSYNLADWTVEALDRELSFVFVNKNSQILTDDSGNGYIPKDANKPKEGLAAILEKYR
jgi:hypothetical protein